MAVVKSIVDNIRDTKLITFLKNKNVAVSDADRGMALHLWLGKILDEGRITSNEVNECLYNELMFGHRRLIRLYELKNVRKIKREFDWQNFMRLYDCPSMNFNRILETNLNENDIVKVAAMSTQSLNGNIQKVNILFVYNLETISKETGALIYHYSYLPVTFDLVAKILVVKVYNKDNAPEDNRPNDQINDIYNRLIGKLDFETKNITINPQKVLYKMSKALFDDFFRQLPNTVEVEAQKASLKSIVNSLLKNITLKNAEIVDGNINISKEVVDVDEEIYKLLQQIVLYDYLKDNKIESLLKNTDKHISRIRFSDRDNLTASLTSEKGVRCIFDAKTFMCIRNSLDLVENIVAIVVSFKKDKGLLSVKYDASDIRYLSVHILNGRYYEEDDYAKIWELYKEYESEDNADVNIVRAEDNAQAM